MTEKFRDTALVVLVLALSGPLDPASAALVAPSWELPPPQQTTGVFWQEHWYERQPADGATRRLRINAPETVLGRFASRPEARENGLMVIEADEDLGLATAAEFYAELWGGHPGTANKRVTVNGRSTWIIPRVGTEEGHCTFSYPTIPLSLSDLVRGRNAFQWALDQGTTFWGHAMVDQACLRLALTNGHPRLAEHALTAFAATVQAETGIAGHPETIRLAVRMDSAWRDQVESVTFQAWYDGYDENGNRHARDWHGFTLDRQPMAYVGTATGEKLMVDWDVRLLPAQKNVAVRGLIRFGKAPGLVYMTPALANLAIPDRPSIAVHLYEPADLPSGFWSRDGRRQICHIELDVEPERIEAAELYVLSWTGGAGRVRDYFTLNGHPFPVAEGSAHTRQYNRLRVESGMLRRGPNRIELLSDTEHHGIEIIYPGPALMVRHRVSP